ncbi:hypothetical protein BIV03_10530 [Curtobacterium sp. MCBA15_016]|nr:hypothetical protein BIV03_10530 [Curtobacterium sp. MCBA15_016]
MRPFGGFIRQLAGLKEACGCVRRHRLSALVKFAGHPLAQSAQHTSGTEVLAQSDDLCASFPNELLQETGIGTREADD